MNLARERQVSNGQGDSQQQILPLANAACLKLADRKARESRQPNEENSYRRISEMCFAEQRPAVLERKHTQKPVRSFY